MLESGVAIDHHRHVFLEEPAAFGRDVDARFAGGFENPLPLNAARLHVLLQVVGAGSL